MALMMLCTFADENGAKSVEQLKTEIQSLAPEGIDYYFDNTGGPMTEAVIQNMNTYGKSTLWKHATLFSNVARITQWHQN